MDSGVRSLLRLFFRLLYHEFAWTYDLVAAVVSLGRWKSWVRAALPSLHGRVLEIGFGPGHLQAALQDRSLLAFGVDESRQMARQAQRRLRRKGLSSRLGRARADHLPIADGSFDSIVSTFPSDYIFERQALAEAQRVLAPGGTFIIVPLAWITGSSLPERLAAGLFRLTGEAPTLPPGFQEKLRQDFSRVGLQARVEIIELKGSRVMVITATRMLLS